MGFTDQETLHSWQHGRQGVRVCVHATIRMAGRGGGTSGSAHVGCSGSCRTIGEAGTPHRAVLPQEPQSRSEYLSGVRSGMSGSQRGLPAVRLRRGGNGSRASRSMQDGSREGAAAQDQEERPQASQGCGGKLFSPALVCILRLEIVYVEFVWKKMVSND